MKSKHLLLFAIGFIIALGCFYAASGITYDSDDVYSQKNAADTAIVPISIGIIASVFAGIQLIKLIRSK